MSETDPQTVMNAAAVIVRGVVVVVFLWEGGEGWGGAHFKQRA